MSNIQMFSNAIDDQITLGKECFDVERDIDFTEFGNNTDTNSFS